VSCAPQLCVRPPYLWSRGVGGHKGKPGSRSACVQRLQSRPSLCNGEQSGRSQCSRRTERRVLLLLPFSRTCVPACLRCKSKRAKRNLFFSVGMVRAKRRGLFTSWCWVAIPPFGRACRPAGISRRRMTPSESSAASTCPLDERRDGTRDSTPLLAVHYCG
jgi:hypothetical protein